MSYTRSARTVITVSGSRTISYPASDHGGTTTVHFTQEVPVTVNVHVETSEFDNAVRNTEKNVDVLTGAVTAMDTAQTAAIRESSEKISNTLIDNFYHLINSDLSMQKSENKSELQAKFALLINLSKDMIGKLDRMTADLARLRRHYYKIFKGLDDDLEKRITMLDKNAFDLAGNVGNQLIMTPYKNGIGANMSSMLEMTKTDNLIVTARMKEKSLRVLDGITNSVRKSEAFNDSISSVLQMDADDTAEIEYMPVIFCRSHNVSGNTENNVYTPPINENSRMSAKVCSHMTGISEDNWQKMESSDLENIEQTLLSLIESETAVNDNDKRVYLQMIDLWNRNKSEIKSI